MPKLKTILFALIVLFSITAFASKEVTIIEFNDFHGHVIKSTEDNKIVPGIEKFISAVDKIKKDSGGNWIAVSGGDNYQGTFLSLLAHGAPVNDMFKILGIKYSAVGNHEFDWGTKYFSKWEKSADLTYLAANIIDKNTGKVVSWAKPYGIVKIDGLKIAFIGLATHETPFTTDKKNLKGLKFENNVKVTQKWINYLKSGKALEGKPDAIIALTHIPTFQSKKDGPITGEPLNEINKLCNETKGLDAVLSGHSHKVVCGYVNKIPVIQAGCYGEDIGVLKLYFDDNKLEKTVPSVINVGNEINSLNNSKEGTEILKKYEKKFAKYYEVIGNADGNFKRDDTKVSTLGYFIANVMAKTSGDEIGIINTYGIREDLPSGPIKLYELYDISPFDNYVYSVKMRGKDIEQVIENSIKPDGTIKSQFSGIKVTAANTDDGKYKIISSETENGKPIEPEKYYSVAICDFIYTGGDNFNFSKSIDLKKSKLTVRDSLINYIKKEKVIKPVKEDNFRLIKENEQKKAA